MRATSTQQLSNDESNINSATLRMLRESRQICCRHLLSLHNFCIANAWQKNGRSWPSSSLGYRVQHLQWCHLMANINIYKNDMIHFCASSCRFRDINVLKCWYWNSDRGHSQSTTFTVMPFNGEYQPLQIVTYIFCAGTVAFWDINVSNFNLENLGKGHRSDLNICNDAIWWQIWKS